MSMISVRRHLTRSALDQSIGKHLKKAGWARTSFLRLVGSVRSRSVLLRPHPDGGRIDVEGLSRLVGGVLNLALHCKDWRRRPEEWSPSEDNPIPLFSSLAHHLLADYPVPPVLLSPWFRGRSPETWRQQGWFIHLGRGGSPRTAGLPIPITRRIAHEFAQAPPQFRVEYAIRWAQVLGLGGTESLAHTLARSELGRSFHAEEFWVTVIHFFINNPGIPERDIHAIVDYLAVQRFAPRFATIGDDVDVTLGPAQPDLTMKGRTASSLLRQVARWRKERDDRSNPDRVLLTWDHSSFGEYTRVEEDGTTWTIRELLDSAALVQRGAIDGALRRHLRGAMSQAIGHDLVAGDRGRRGPPTHADDRGQPRDARDRTGQDGPQRRARRTIEDTSRAVGRAAGTGLRSCGIM